MLIRSWRFITLMFTSLNMAMAFCHLLQLASRMSYDGALWRSTQSMYRLFGPPVGAAIEGGASVSTAALPFLVRERRPAFRWTLAGALAWLVAAVSWWIFIAPVNAEMADWTPETMPPDWMQYRNQWEYAHAARAVLMIAGFGGLVYSVLVETSGENKRDYYTNSISRDSRSFRIGEAVRRKVFAR